MRNPTSSRRKRLATGADDFGQRIRDGAHEALENGQEALEHLGSTVRGQVRDRPLAALMIAGGVGLLLGILIDRRR